MPTPRRSTAVLVVVLATALAAASATGLAVRAAHATPLQVYGVWHAGDDYCIWGSVRTVTDFDSKNHWIVDRGDGAPSVNLVILSFVHPMKLLERTTDATTLDGVPRGMTQEIVDYFKSRGIRVMLSIGGITYVTPWETALAQDATQLGLNAAEVATRLGVGIEIDYEGDDDASIDALADFIAAYRSVHPYDASGASHAARLTIDLAAGDRWLIALCERSTREWLTTQNPVLDYANAMVPARQPSPSGAISNWQEHLDGKPQYNPPIPPLAPCKFTAGLWLSKRSVTDECTNFNASVHYATRDFVMNAPPNGAGSSPGLLGYMFWAAECQGTHGDCTTPPNACTGGLGVGSSYFQIPIPMPALRQDGGGTVDASASFETAFALYGGQPNPARAGMRIGFALPEVSRVDLRVYDVTGRQAARVASGDWPAGRHAIAWEPMQEGGGALAPGTYYLRMRATSASKLAFERTLPITIVP